ncbi:MAG: adenine deaminase [Deltaproteobacteria bacterium]|jgi:adenine deaminase|nr:adenine deaminase [Deltaproteobacteria bacterium]
MPKPFDRSRVIQVALGEIPADLVIKGANIFDSFSGRFRKGDLAVSQGYIAGIGSYSGKEEISALDNFLLPGFLDAHVHIESSMTTPMEFARALNATGTTSVICDPHEIANVAGIEGIKFFLETTEEAPIDIYVMLPSCVPASHLDSGGATLTAEDLAPLLTHPRVLGLGEMMNYPGVLTQDAEVIRKLSLLCPDKKLLFDGHAPGVIGKALNAYASTGISSDHETTKAGELTEKLSAGIFMLLREGSAAKNLVALLPAVTTYNSRFCAFATDDRHARDLLTEGSINYLCRLALATGLIPLPDIINMASLNGALHYNLPHTGALAPGYQADMALYSDLWSFRPTLVWKNGVNTARDGVSLVSPSLPTQNPYVRNTVRIGDIKEESLKIPGNSGEPVRVIGVLARQIITESLVIELPTLGGFILPDPENDVAKLAVFNRYTPNATPSLGFIKNLGLKRGAIAETVSHDSHNLIVAGVSDKDMILAVKRIAEMEGGLVAILDGKILAELPLPVGGLMTLKSLPETAEALALMMDSLPTLGFPVNFEPFMTLSFMSLPVIPSLKLTSQGLVDVNTFQIVPLI